jgi:hypothetical protein
MSSTTGIQNLLVNAFRPAYTYDTTSTLYTVKLDMSNVNTYYGNSANVLWAQVGDIASNVYVGKGAGNDPTITVRACSNVTAVGYSTASSISNVSNSVFVGTETAANAQSMSNMVGVGYRAGTGTASVRVGSDTSGNGVSNTVIGSSSTTSTYSNCILVGPGLTADQSWRFRLGGTPAKPYILGDISTGWMGINATSPITSYTRLDVSGDEYVKGNLGINIAPGTRTLDVNGNFRVQDASSNTLDFSNGNFTVQKGSNTLYFSNSAFLVRDTCLNTISYDGGRLNVIDASSTQFDVCGGITTSSTGFRSVTGTFDSLSNSNAGVVAFGKIKAGSFLVTARDLYDDGCVSYLFASSPTTAGIMCSNRLGNQATISTSGTDIRFEPTVAGNYTINYTITYFPVP